MSAACSQRTAGLAILGAVVLFVVLLPLFILLRADDSDGWPWPVALIPLWTFDALYGAGLVWRLVTAMRARDAGGPAHPSLGLKPTLMAITMYIGVVGAQILLVMRLSSASSLIGYSLALVPLYVALLTSAVPSMHNLAVGVKRKACPSAEAPPPTWQQLAQPMLELLGHLLLAATLALAGLNGDGLVEINWWLVLLPSWLHLAVLWVRWGVALRSTLASRDSGEREEERAAKLGALAIGGLLGVLCTLCFFLLALRIGGQTDYAAWLIALPIFGALALAACCCGCLACLAGVVARAQQMGGAGAGHPPYHPVGDEEAATSTPPPSVSGEQPGSKAASVPPVASPMGSPQSAAASAASAAATRADEASRMAAAVDLGQQIASGEAAAASSSRSDGRSSGLAGGWWAAPAATVSPSDAVGGAASPRAAAAPAPELVSLSAGRPLESLSTKQLKKELTALGVAHEHCLEKGELLALLMQAEGRA